MPRLLPHGDSDGVANFKKVDTHSAEAPYSSQFGYIPPPQQDHRTIAPPEKPQRVETRGEASIRDYGRPDTWPDTCPRSFHGFDSQARRDYEDYEEQRMAAFARASRARHEHEVWEHLHGPRGARSYEEHDGEYAERAAHDYYSQQYDPLYHHHHASRGYPRGYADYAAGYPGYGGYDRREHSKAGYPGGRDKYSHYGLTDSTACGSESGDSEFHARPPARGGREPEEVGPAWRACVLRRLPSEVTATQVREAFVQFGVKSVKLTSGPRFCFVNFFTHEGAVSAKAAVELGQVSCRGWLAANIDWAHSNLDAIRHKRRSRRKA